MTTTTTRMAAEDLREVARKPILQSLSLGWAALERNLEEG
jgi:hypothetical protein